MVLGLSDGNASVLFNADHSTHFLGLGVVGSVVVMLGFIVFDAVHAREKSWLEDDGRSSALCVDGFSSTVFFDATDGFFIAGYPDSVFFS